MLQARKRELTQTPQKSTEHMDDRGGLEGRRWVVLSVLRYSASAALTMLLPLVLYQLPPSMTHHTYGQAYRPYEFFGLSGTLFIFYNVSIEIRHRSFSVKRDWLAVLLPILVAFQALHWISEFSLRSYDYNTYQAAAAILLSQGNPYDVAYLYPPVLAQALAACYRAIVLALPNDLAASPQIVWDLVFYSYRCLQFFLVIAAYWLSYRFARDLGADKNKALVVVTALFAANTPLMRTLRHNQVNLLVLDSALLAVLLLRQLPFFSGMLVSFGGLIKLYPFLLTMPWLLLRKWGAVLGVVVSVITVLVMQVGFGNGLVVWRQFMSSLTGFQRSNAFRDNSIRGLLMSTVRILGIADVDHIDKLVLLVTVVLGLIYALRSWRRVSDERSRSLLPADHLNDYALSYGLMVDALGFMLLLSPLVWEHHFVLIMPLSIWTLVTAGSGHFWGIVIANALIYLIPTFDVYPISYHRLLGLCLLLYYSSPRLNSDRSSTGSAAQPVECGELPV